MSPTLSDGTSSRTGIFGVVTEQAVQKFQIRTGIISSINPGTPATTGYGVVGPQTRAKIYDISCLDAPIDIPTEETGSVKSLRVGEDLEIMAGTSWALDSGVFSTSNPQVMTGVSGGAHTIRFTDLPNFSESYSTCTYPQGGTECHMSNPGLYSTSGISCISGACSVSVSVFSDVTTKIAIRYSPSSPIDPGTSALKILPLGDSITDGYPWSDEIGGYRSELYTLLRNAGHDVSFVGSQKSGPSVLADGVTPFDRDHEGYRGYMISQIDLGISTYMDQGNPTHVLMMLGTNDIIRVGDAAGALLAANRLSALIDRVLAHDSNPTVLVASIPPRIPTWGTNEWIIVYNEHVKEFVQDKIATGKKVKFVDIYNALTAADIMPNDGLHPNADGYSKIAKTWFFGMLDSLSVTSLPPEITLSANPTSIQSTESSILSWSATRALSCSAPWTASTATSGNQSTGQLAESSTFTITCTGAGGSVSKSVSVSVVTPPTPAPIVTLTASPAVVESGQSSAITWSHTNTTSCVASGFQNPTGSNGTYLTSPLVANSTYNLTCSGPGGTRSATATVSVAPVVGTNTLTASLIDGTSRNAGPSYVFGPGAGIYTDLDWHWRMNLNLASQKTISSVEIRTISSGEIWSSVADGYYPVLIYQNGTLKNTAYGQTVGPLSAGQHTFDLYGQIYYTTWNGANLTVRFTDGTSLTAQIPNTTTSTPAPTVTLSANPTSVSSGQSSTLTWSSTNATSCTASGGWSGTKVVSGSQSTGILTANSTFILTCTGAGGSATQSATVTVTSVQLPTLTISASPTSVSSGQSSTLTWSSTNTTSCTASGGWSGSKATSGSQSTGTLTANSTFILTCTGAGGSTFKDVVVSVATAGGANSLTSSLLDTLSDKAGKHSIFTAGQGAFYTPEDWHFRANISLSTTKTITSIEVTGMTNGHTATWSTSNPNFYPLVILENGVQKNSGYSGNFGTYQSGSYTLDLYTQKDYTPFSNGSLVVKFNDGTSLSTPIVNNLSNSAFSPKYASTFDALQSIIQMLERAGIPLNL